jgi:hypothetical protein
MYESISPEHPSFCFLLGAKVDLSKGTSKNSFADGIQCYESSIHQSGISQKWDF